MVRSFFRKTVGKIVALVAPEGLVVAGAFVAVRSGALGAAGDGFLTFYTAAVFATGAILAWRFHKSSVLYSLAVLLLADRGLSYFAATATDADAAAAALQTTAFLLPLNLAAFGSLRERGILSTAGAVRALGVAIQAALVAGVVPAESSRASMILDPGIRLEALPPSPLAVPALAALAAGLTLLGARMAIRTRALPRGFFWATAAAALALFAEPASARATLYFSTAGLALVVAVVESSYSMAYRDGLTGLPGRRALNEALARLTGIYTVAMVDVDHFKKFNDKYGHDVGDQVLRMVAARLGSAGGGGKAFRYGGEEFALIFSGKDLETTLPHLERMRESVEATGFTLRDRRRPRKRPKKRAKSKSGRKKRKTVSISVSIGAAERDERNDAPEDVIAAADAALYRAKSAGRNRVKS